MSENGIGLELRLLYVSFISGIIIVAAYDILGMIRSAGRHGRFLRLLEEFAFWGAAGWWLFAILNGTNYGVIRYFSMLGLFLGMIGYRVTVKDVFRKSGVRLIEWVKKKLWRVLGFVLRPFAFVGRRIFWVFEFLYRKGKRKLRLKHRLKKIKIGLAHKLERKVSYEESGKRPKKGQSEKEF